MSKLLGEFGGMGCVVSSPIFQLDVLNSTLIHLYDDKLVFDNAFLKEIVFKKDEIECIKQAKLIGGIQIVHKKQGVEPFVYFNTHLNDDLHKKLLIKLKEGNYPLK